MSFLSILNGSKYIEEAYEVIKEWEVYVGWQKVKIKVKLGPREKFYYSTSHYYHGSQQAGPYMSSRNGFDTIESALSHAKQQILSFYDPNDEKAKWKINEDY
ncbi:hypothetical protein [Brevibacillus sp. HD1.4A]|uniref:hypothetical protein n=1 Tax=Brevibacillus TaxID=55080 RepID=UPI00156A7A46|nr:hypothetical protein [Brevibacillus sp. HD1.4A]NRQ51972.1 hypothetical protein [Brevibacillus sp. HD1.4A]